MIAFGNFKGSFEGNPKYLFIEMSKEGRDVVWLSYNKATVAHVRQLGLRAYCVLTPRGAWRALRSKWWFVGAYTSDILFCLSGRAKVVNLWHGVGIKRIEYNAVSGPIYDRFIRKTPKQVFYHPEAFRKPDYVVTASEYQTNMFMPAFRIGKERCIECSYPRNSILVASEETRKAFIDRYESHETIELVEQLKQYNRVYIYMPTWRDSQKEIFTEGIDLVAVNQVLAARNEMLILKPHANTKLDAIDDFSNVMLFQSRADIYPILPYTNCLITDYSSIIYDYVLMEGKSVILYVYDYKDYVGIRDFFYPFDENVVGQRAETKEELLNIFKQGPKKLDEAERKALVEKFWGKEPNKYDFGNYLHL